MKLVAKHSEDKKLIGNVLTIANEAREAKRLNPAIIDATIGTLFDEQGKMLEFDIVNKTISDMTYVEKYAYATTAGGNDFKEGIAKWTLRQTFDEVTAKMFYQVVASPGGSGAISNAIANYTNPNDIILLPNICWGPYNNMAKEHFTKVETYNLFNENNEFNLEEFKRKIALLKEKQQRVFTIINDPCQNPTGFALEDNEWDEIIDYVNEESKDTPFIIVYDMAYIDYSHKGLEGSREVFRKFTRFNENVMIIVCFSGSKTFSLYGLRIGAEMCLTKNEEAASDFYYASEYSARSLWSNTTRLGITLVSKLMNNKNNVKKFEDEVKKASQMLLSRSTLFLQEAKEINLPMYPYRSGFFVTIPCDGNAVYEKLKAKGIYVVPMKKAVRISLSAINLEEIKGLAQKILMEL